MIIAKLFFVALALFGSPVGHLETNKGAVVSSSAIASEAGAAILREGGNAVDAAVATGLALAVTHPAAGNIGGGGFMMIRLKDGTCVAIDYREAAPLAASRNMYLDSGGNVSEASLVGYRAAGVPGTVAGLALAQRKYGRLKWADVVEPARMLAVKGFPLSASYARSLERSKLLARFPESKRVFQRDGKAYQAGEMFVQADLGRTLQRIARDPEEFYRGDTARLIVEEMKRGGGLITLDDLRGYRPVVRMPLRGTYRGYEILSMPPPSSGGIAIIESLNILERFDLAAAPNRQHLLVEAMRRAFADRAEFLGDPDFAKVPVEGLISKSYAAELARGISLDRAQRSADVGHGAPVGAESHETTHFTVVDSEGNAVANTYTLNMGFGCGVTVTGAGFLLNNEMDDFAAKPGSPNGFGLIQGEANAIAPHKRPLSSMSPTFVVRNGKLILAVGSPGGPTIINTVLQHIVNLIDLKMGLVDSMAAPRIHHQWLPDRIEWESGLPEATRRWLSEHGHLLAPRATVLGEVMAIQIDPVSGRRTAVADPRSSDAGAVSDE